MKFRIVRKKLKKDVLLNLWVKSLKDWEIALGNITDKYPDVICAYNQMDSCSYNVGYDMMEFDWQNILKRGEQLGFGNKIIYKYFNGIR